MMEYSYEEEQQKLAQAVAREHRRGRRRTILAIVCTAVCCTAVFFTLHYAVYGSTLETALHYRSVLEAAKIIEDKYIADYDSTEMSDAAIDGFLTALGDKWSYYVDAEELEDYRSHMTNSYVGVGITVQKAEGGPLQVMAVLEGGGAAEAGIVTGDLVYAVNDEDITGLTLNEASRKIQTGEGTQVRLLIEHADGSRETLTVDCRSVNTAPVTYEMVDKIGYIRIRNFNETSADGFLEAMEALQADGAEGFVFDVRFNGGGLVTELTKMLDYLLPEGEIFRMVNKAGKADVTNSDAACITLPMAVLVNDNSYSAAEFFAAALQEYGAATVVGTHTTGKGYAQTSYYLSDGTCLVLSSKAYFTPHGKSLADVGIAPDVELDLNEEDYAALYYDALAQEDDEQWNAAMDAVQQQIP